MALCPIADGKPSCIDEGPKPSACQAAASFTFESGSTALILLYGKPGYAIMIELGLRIHQTSNDRKGGMGMPVQTKGKANRKMTATRIISLVLAVLMLGSVLLAALFSNIY